jgi:DNA-binding response OmpR family regulator
VTLLRRVVYVEDSDHDALMFETAIDHCSLAAETRRFETAAAAVAYVDRLVDGDTPLPDLAVVDINLADGSGLTVLERLRAEFDAATLPAVVFSGSEDPTDVETAYAIGANLYLVKPLSFDEYRRRLAGACCFLAGRDVENHPSDGGCE